MATGVPGRDLSARWLQGSLQIGYAAGSAWYVNSQTGNALNTGVSWLNPMATIDQAVDKCTASRGDVIYVASCHAENLAADSAIDIDVVGVTVQGIRRGREMPTLTYTAAAGDCKLAAANTSIRDIRFLGGIDVGTGCIEVSAADCSIIDCEFRDVTGEATDVVMLVAGADRCLIDGYKHFGAAGAGGNSAISINDADDVEIKNFYIYGNFAVGAIDFRTAASARANIHDGKIWTENAADIAIVDTITTSTGIIGPNLQLLLQDDAANATASITGATFSLFDPIYVCNAAAEKGYLIPWTASTG